MGSSPNEFAFEAALKNCGNLDCFLEDFFSFLNMRTDFFIECPSTGGPFGFLSGQAEQMLITKFKKWQNIHKESKRTIPLEKLSENIKSIETINNLSNIKTENYNISLKLPSKRSDMINLKNQSNQSSDSYNGGITSKYSWSQSINDLDVKIPCDKIKKGKELIVDIKSNSISIKLANNDMIIIEGKFEFNIIKNESYWNLIPGEGINIWLQKSEERWWKFLIIGETPIDLSKIEAEKPMEDLNDVEQMKVQELIWKNEQKRMGLTTENNEKIEEILKKAWNQDGSPFNGPFDPSIINFDKN